MERLGAWIGGAALMMAGRHVLRRLLVVRAQWRMNQVRAGNLEPALRQYAPDAMLRLGEGEHRWAGEHAGREKIEAFLRAFADARLVGTFHEAWTSGPPWDMRIVLRFDERLVDEHGRVVYQNDLAMMMRARWGRVVAHADLSFSTARIEALERRLRASERELADRGRLGSDALSRAKDGAEPW